MIKKRILPLDRILEIGLELADALSRTHHLNIIHRDLKPGNVLLAADGSPRLTDFGIARLVEDRVHLTQTGILMGSPTYASPEVLNDEALDVRTDIWSFGVLLYEMLAGRPPFVGQTMVGVITAIMNEPFPSIRQFRPDTPPALVTLLAGMLVKERQHRAGSMRQVAAELERIRTTLTENRASVHPSPEVTAGAHRPPSKEQPFSSSVLASREISSSGLSETTDQLAFVARQQELDRLSTFLEAALAGQGQVAFVVGEAGRGKTALVQAFAQQAQKQHVDLIATDGNCNAYGGAGDPYLPFCEVLGLLTGDVEARLVAGGITLEHAHRLWTAAPWVNAGFGRSRARSGQHLHLRFKSHQACAGGEA